MRSNRILGATLVEHNLVQIEHLEAANERLFEILQAGVTQQASLLGILQREMGSLTESDIINFQLREFGLGLIDLEDYMIPDDCRELIEPELTWATWTMPFDQEEGFYFVATSYYLSQAAQTFWEEKLGKPIIWYIATMDSLAEVARAVADELQRKR